MKITWKPPLYRYAAPSAFSATSSSSSPPLQPLTRAPPRAPIAFPRFLVSAGPRMVKYFRAGDVIAAVSFNVRIATIPRCLGGEVLSAGAVRADNKIATRTADPAVTRPAVPHRPVEKNSWKRSVIIRVIGRKIRCKRIKRGGRSPGNLAPACSAIVRKGTGISSPSSRV